MCKYNETEIREVRATSGETYYCLRDVLRTVGYSEKGVTKLVCQITKEHPETLYMNMSRLKYISPLGLRVLASRASQAPAFTSKNVEWGKFLRFIGGGSRASLESHNQQPELFNTVDSLIEEYTSFKEQYQREHEELLALRAQVRRYREAAAVLNSVSGF